jgi:hypothetical protein
MWNSATPHRWDENHVDLKTWLEIRRTPGLAPFITIGLLCPASMDNIILSV